VPQSGGFGFSFKGISLPLSGKIGLFGEWSGTGILPSGFFISPSPILPPLKKHHDTKRTDFEQNPVTQFERSKLENWIGHSLSI
jgi:hypothetical protein